MIQEQTDENKKFLTQIVRAIKNLRRPTVLLGIFNLFYKKFKPNGRG